jgi:hypothetical protein
MIDGTFVVRIHVDLQPLRSCYIRIEFRPTVVILIKSIIKQKILTQKKTHTSMHVYVDNILSTTIGIGGIAEHVVMIRVQTNLMFAVFDV